MASVTDPIETIVGKTVRVYETGDLLTQDFIEDRLNIELKPGTQTVVKVWFG